MSFDQHRWRCGCGANNMIGVTQCFRCGSAKPAPIHPLVTPPTYHPATGTVHQQRKFPWWVWGICALPVVGILASPTILALARAPRGMSNEIPAAVSTEVPAAVPTTAPTAIVQWDRATTGQTWGWFTNTSNEPLHGVRLTVERSRIEYRSGFAQNLVPVLVVADWYLPDSPGILDPRRIKSSVQLPDGAVMGTIEMPDNTRLTIQPGEKRRFYFPIRIPAVPTDIVAKDGDGRVIRLEQLDPPNRPY